MSFDISVHGETRRLHAADEQFVDDAGCRYFGFFDGSDVTFRSDAAYFPGRWIQGTDAVTIPGGDRLTAAFKFTVMDHGPRPQRLHAIWKFDGPVEQAIAGWKEAEFSVSHADRRWNRNHPPAIHLRTRGAFGTGADSSHVIIPLSQSGAATSGDIHVGEFNPLTGFGLGFALHRLEPWLFRHA